MKIGYVLDTTLNTNDGVQQYFKGLARYMLHKGHDIRFLVPPSKKCSEFKDRIISFGRTITLKGNANTIPTVFFTPKKSIKKALAQEQFDILHVSAPFSPFLGAKVIVEASCPVVITYTTLSKGIVYRIGAKLLQCILKRSYNKIDAFVALSQAAKEEAEESIPGDYVVIPAGIDLEKFSPHVKPLQKFSNDTKLNILYLGRLEKRKGVAYLIKAFKTVKEKCTNARLIIAGDGPERQRLEKLVSDLKLQDVLFEGYIDEDKKQQYYASAHVCVFPATRGESFGVVLIESMASGKVTIGFANDGYKCVLSPLPKLLVKNRDVAVLASRIQYFLLSDDLRKKYEQKCLHEADKYRWKTVGSRIAAMYQDVCANHS